MNQRDLEIIKQDLLQEYEEIIVDAIIVEGSQNSLWVQKRRTDRAVFPGNWEFPGATLRGNETINDCVARALKDDCGMTLVEILGLANTIEWGEHGDTITAQFIVTAAANYTPDYSKVSEHKLITAADLDLLKADGNDPTYRGAYYAFKGLHNPDLTQKIAFYDKVVIAFFKYFTIRETPPLVNISEAEKKFSIDAKPAFITVSPRWLAEDDGYSGINVVLHQLYHNYLQGISSYQDIVMIREVYGSAFSQLIDIHIDVKVSQFLHDSYGLTTEHYIHECLKRIADYQDENIEDSKFSRLLGAALSLQMQTDTRSKLVLPVMHASRELHILVLNDTISYYKVTLGEKSLLSLVNLFTKQVNDVSNFLEDVSDLVNILKRST